MDNLPPAPPFESDKVLLELTPRFQEQLKKKSVKIELIKRIQHERRPYTEEEYLTLNEKESLFWPEQVAILLAVQTEKKCNKRDHYQPSLIKDDKDFFDVIDSSIDKVKKGEAFFHHFIIMDYFPPGVLDGNYDQKTINHFNRESVEARRKPELEDGGIRQWHCFPVSVAFDGRDISLFTLEFSAIGKDLNLPIAFEDACTGSTIGHVKRLALGLEQALDKKVNVYFGYFKIQLDQHSCPIFAIEYLNTMYHEGYNLCHQLTRCHIGDPVGESPNIFIPLIQDECVDPTSYPKFFKNSQNSSLNVKITNLITEVSHAKKQNFTEYLKQHSILKPKKETETPTEAASRNCAIDFKANKSIREALNFIKNTPDSLENIVNRQMGRNVSILNERPAFADKVTHALCFSEGAFSGFQSLGSENIAGTTADKKLIDGRVKNGL